MILLENKNLKKEILYLKDEVFEFKNKNKLNQSKGLGNFQVYINNIYSKTSKATKTIESILIKNECYFF